MYLIFVRLLTLSARYNEASNKTNLERAISNFVEKCKI